MGFQSSFQNAFKKNALYVIMVNESVYRKCLSGAHELSLRATTGLYAHYPMGNVSFMTSTVYMKVESVLHCNSRSECTCCL